MIRLSSLLIAFTLLACNSPTRGLEAIESANSPDRIVVAPLNLALRMPAEINGMEGPVWTALLEHFVARERKVQQIDENDARGLWSDVVMEMGDARELTGATRRFAQILAEHTEYDLLVIPALVMRRASVRGHHAYWDGVRRKIEVNSAWGGSITETGVGATVHGLNGQLAGASLYVTVLRPDGQAVYEGLGGLDLLQKAEQARHAQRGEWAGALRRAARSVAVRTEPFETPKNLEEGIRVALERELPRTARSW